MRDGNGWHSRWILPAVMAAGVAAFGFALHNAPIGDDIALAQQRLAAVHGWADVPRLMSEPYWGNIQWTGLYRPFTLAVLAIQKLLWGSTLWPSRLVSLGLHAGCIACVWVLAGRILNRTGQLLASLLFAVHPIHAEAVITLYAQSDLWAALPALFALTLHLRWCEQKTKLGRWFWIAALYAASLGFKESAILLPVALGLLRGMLTDRLGSGVRRWFGPSESIVAAVLLVYLPLRLIALGGDWGPHGQGVVGHDAGWNGRLSIVTVSAGTYFRLLAWPWKQTVYYGHLRDNLAAGGWIEAILLIGVAAALSALWSSHRFWATAGTIILGCFLLPVINLVPIGAVVAERCLYLPSVGFVLIVAGLAQARLKAWPAPATAGAMMLLTIAGIALSSRVCDRWRDMRSLWEHTLADHPTSPRAGAMVVLLRLEQSTQPPAGTEIDQLNTLLDRTERLNPRSPELWLARAVLAHRCREPARAAEFLMRAESLRPGISKSLPH